MAIAVEGRPGGSYALGEHPPPNGEEMQPDERLERTASEEPCDLLATYPHLWASLTEIARLCERTDLRMQVMAPMEETYLFDGQIATAIKTYTLFQIHFFHIAPVNEGRPPYRGEVAVLEIKPEVVLQNDEKSFPSTRIVSSHY